MNNLISINNNELTMSSREIAELTGKQHKHVLRDIDNMFTELNIDSDRYAQNWAHPQNKQIYKEYQLPKKYIECLLTGYSIPLRMKVIDRLHELESKTQIMVPKNLPEALRLAAELAEEKELLKIEVNELKPKAEFHDIAINTHGSVSVGQAAKTIGTGRNRLLEWMRQHKWINRRNEPYQEKIEQGLLDVKLSNWDHPERGIQEVITTLVTGKGLTKLSQMLNERIAA